MVSEEWRKITKRARPTSKPVDESFSIAGIKTKYVSENLALEIIRGQRIEADSPIIRRLLPKIRKLGQRRA